MYVGRPNYISHLTHDPRFTALMTAHGQSSTPQVGHREGATEIMVTAAWVQLASDV